MEKQRFYKGEEVTHDELLDVIAFDEGMEDSKKVYSALRAVVELHKPCNSCGEPNCNMCRCSHIYPCPTIQAIEEMLG